MASKTTKKRVYRETIFPIIEGKMTKQAFSFATGHSGNYINGMFIKGYNDVKVQAIALWASILGVTPEDITAIPVAKKVETPQTTTVVDLKTEALEALIIDGFRMIHQDLLTLIETMDKYWKPEMPTIDRGQREKDD